MCNNEAGDYNLKWKSLYTPTVYTYLEYLLYQKFKHKIFYLYITLQLIKCKASHNVAGK